LVAGRPGAARRVHVVNIMEVPDIVRWMRGGELLLTTAYPVRDDPSSLLRLIAALDDRNVAALGVKFGPYLAGPPDGLLELADERQFPLIEIPPDVIFNDVLSEVLGTILNRQALELERLVMIHDRLTNVMLAGGSIAELTYVMSQLIELPAAVVDAHGRVVATAGGAAADDPSVGTPVRIPIRIGDLPGGEVVVWPGAKSLQARDMMTIEQTSTMAAVAMAQERALLSREQRHRTLFLMELTSGRPVNWADAARRAAAMGWDLELPRAVVLVDLSTDSGPTRVAGQPAEERLSRVVRTAAGPRSVVWTLQSGLAVLAEPVPSVGATCSSIRRALAEDFPGVRAMIGAGGVYTDPGGLQRSHSEAVEAVTLGRQLHGDEFIVRNEELGVYRLLDQVPKAELRKHCERALGPLLAYDERYHGNLVHTLDVYLAYGGNRVGAARELCVHYNTLRYRLELITKLTGGIDKDATSRLDLEIALTARRLLLSRNRLV
jgi:purine catabolism regulator